MRTVCRRPGVEVVYRSLGSENSVQESRSGSSIQESRSGRSVGAQESKEHTGVHAVGKISKYLILTWWFTGLIKRTASPD